MTLPRLSTIRFHAARWIWVAGLAVLAEVAFPVGIADVAPRLSVGTRADHDIIAPFDFVVGKSEADLQRETEEIVASARPIYEFRVRTYDSVRVDVQRFFTAVNAVAAEGSAAVVRVAGDVEVPLDAAEGAYLAVAAKRQGMQRALADLVQRTLGQGVVANLPFEGEPAPQLIVRRGEIETPVAREQVLTFDDYLQRAQAIHPDPGSSVGDVVYLKLVRHFFRPTLTRNELETARRRSELAATVAKSKYAVRQGDVIVGANQVVTEPAREKLAALRVELVHRGAAISETPAGVAGMLLRNLMILSVYWVLMLFYRRETYRELRQVGTVAVLFACAILAAAVVARTEPAHGELILLPFTAMMLTVLFNGRVSMIGAMILSVLFAVQPALHDSPALFLCFAGGVTAALSVKSLRRRTHLYLAVLLVGVGYLATSLALGMAGDWSWSEIGMRTLFGTANGLVSASLTILLLPVAERVAQITTDLTLLELSDPSRPLLRRLSLEASGSYAHSVSMANLVEAACDRIGANGLLGRVGCYYHDIGKLANPQYFAENQSIGGNPHDRLTPRQSAEIIKQHVPEGLRLAREAGLPRIVAAFIPEHHGTAEITYFYDRAKRQGEPGLKREDFCYPGPRPRSVETAVAMLADAVEAALRVIEAMTPAKLEAAIDQIVKSRLASGQLDEAPLTLQQVDQVRAEFVRVLTSMYHNRIDYPESSGGLTKSFQAAQHAAGG